MKNTFKYIFSLLLLLTMVTSCQDNENWTIINDVQPGAYVVGDATVYSAAVGSSQFKDANLDNAPAGTDVKGIYTWLKAGKEFKVVAVDATGTQVAYGKGAVVDNGGTVFETYALDASAAAFTVKEDGLYNLVLNNTDKQLNIIPVKIGIIGDATPSGWDNETLMSAPELVSSSSATKVVFTMKSQELAKKGMKFRYAHNWGIEIPYGKGKVKFHSNLGLVTAGSLSGAFSNLKGGGENFAVPEAALYDITLELNLRSGLASAKGVKVGDVVKTATLPEKMFINGSPFSSDWAWAKASEMTKVNSHDGWFWGIYYFPADAGLKLNSAMAWNGNDFGSADDKVSYAYGDVTVGAANLKIKTAGFYQVVVKCSLSADKQSVINTISLLEPAIYLMGDVSGNWDNMSPTSKFTLDASTGIYTSPAFIKADKVRMYAAVAGAEWWQTEFNIFDGAIKYRGAGGDQPVVLGTVGQKAMLNFAEGTGAIQ